MKKLLEQQGEDLLLAGAWFLVIGTTISAAGQTRLVATGDINGKESTVIGNSVEAFGNALQGVGRGKINTADPSIPGKIAEAGCWVQAGGNTTNAVGIQQEVNGEVAQENLEEEESITEEEKKELEEFFENVQDNGEQINGLGSTVQSSGALLEAYGVAHMKPSISTPYEVVGNTVIAFGSAVDAVGSVFILQDQEETGEWIELAGAYIQVIGSAIGLYGLTIASMVPKEESGDFDENERYSYKRLNKK